MNAAPRNLGIAVRNGQPHTWYRDDAGNRRWLDSDQLLAGEIQKGNADLVDPQAWNVIDFEARR